MEDCHSDYVHIEGKGLVRESSSSVENIGLSCSSILPTGEFLHHINSSQFHFRWWRKGSHTRRRVFGPSNGESRDWAVHSNTFPRDDVYRRLKTDERTCDNLLIKVFSSETDRRLDFIEIGFRAACFKVTEKNWPHSQINMQIDKDEAMCDEGFLCIITPIPIELPQGTDRQKHVEDWRPVYLLSTMDNSPIALPHNGVQLLRPLISKFSLIVEENCTVATSQLSKSVSR